MSAALLFCVDAEGRKDTYFLFGASNLGSSCLGSGGMSAYTRPGETWTFYEINPVMVRIARTPAYFTYVSDFSGDIPCAAILERCA